MLPSSPPLAQDRSGPGPLWPRRPLAQACGACNAMVDSQGQDVVYGKEMLHRDTLYDALDEHHRVLETKGT